MTLKHKNQRKEKPQTRQREDSTWHLQKYNKRKIYTTTTKQGREKRRREGERIGVGGGI